MSFRPRHSSTSVPINPKGGDKSKYAFVLRLAFFLVEFLTETIWKAVQEPACLSAHSREIPNVHKVDHHVPVNTSETVFLQHISSTMFYGHILHGKVTSSQ